MNKSKGLNVLNENNVDLVNVKQNDKVFQFPLYQIKIEASSKQLNIFLNNVKLIFSINPNLQERFNFINFVIALQYAAGLREHCKTDDDLISKYHQLTNNLLNNCGAYFLLEKESYHIDVCRTSFTLKINPDKDLSIINLDELINILQTVIGEKIENWQ